jgi:hypothetical protein
MLNAICGERAADFFEALAAYIYRTAVFVGTVAVTFLSLVALGKVLG